MRIIIALIALLLSVSASEKASAQASTDWFKASKDCAGEFESRTKCLEEKIKALEGRANIIETNLKTALARIESLEKAVKTPAGDDRISILERTTIKAGQPVTFMADFRKQCLHWIDTAQSPTFVWCNSGPDPRDEAFAIFPR
jgi:hypothetical protein